MKAGGQLAAALKNLAASADAQTDYLHRLGTAPSADELALEFDDAIQGRESAATGSIRKLDQLLHSMSGPARSHLWDVSALHDAPEWAEVRRLAALAIAELDTAGDAD